MIHNSLFKRCVAKATNFRANNMGRLFWKIFLWFWLTLLLISVSVFIGTSLFLQDESDNERKKWRPHFRSQAVSQVLQFSGEDAARNMLERIRSRRGDTLTYIIDDDGEEILGRHVDRRLLNSQESRIVIAPDGEEYRVFSNRKGLERSKNRPPRPSLERIFKQFFKKVVGLWLGIALTLSSLVCFWLAWYLTSPIRKLQHAAKQLSEGKLDTRVSQHMGNRKDEIADLGYEFDLMAARLQTLIINQKQLLSDVSHELRSPLARLQVAVGLARKKTGKEAEEDLRRIEQETERLDDLVGQSLTLSRLDAGADYPMDDYIDMSTLLEDIIKDCDFEASDQEKRVTLTFDQSWTIKANAELLRRALENVVRNAIHYTNEKSTVEVTLEKNPNNPGEFLISVCDQGPGVPNDKLSDLFDPFVRLSSARDRDSGGYGLGLAIAKRAIQFHDGKIKARNRSTQGLCIEISLALPIKTPK